MPEGMLADTDPVKGLHPVFSQTLIGQDVGSAGNGQNKTSRLGGQVSWIGMSLKLRDLKPNEAALIKELDDGYKKARKIFKGRDTRRRNYSDTVNISSYVAAEESDNDAFYNDDSDMWLVSGEA